MLARRIIYCFRRQDTWYPLLGGNGERVFTLISRLFIPHGGDLQTYKRA